MKGLDDLLFRSSEQPIWLCNGETLRFVEVNDAACRRYGLRREAFLGLRIDELVAPGAPHLLRTLFLPDSGQMGAAGTWRHYFNDGTVHDITLRPDLVERDGQSCRLVSSQEITPRQARDPNADTHGIAGPDMGLLLQLTNDVVWDWDIACGTVWWSDKSAETLGFAPVDLQQPGAWLDQVAPGERDAVTLAIDAMARGERDAWQATYRFKRGDGRDIIVSDRAVVMKDAAGKPQRIIGSKADVSEVTGLRERVSQAGKLAALGQLSGGVAHDFNNILTIIIGNLEMLQASCPPLDADLLMLGELTLGAAERAARLTSRLLTFGRRQVMRSAVVDINRQVREAMPLLNGALPASIQLRFLPEIALSPVVTDLAQLELALLNLVLNARDALPDGGRITVTSADVRVRAIADRPDHVQSGQLQPGHYVILAVEDDGAGMASDVLARAFDPFFTTKPAGQGSGLGLSSVYEFARQSGGTVYIASAPGAGTCVRLYLPAADRAPGPVCDPGGDGPVPGGACPDGAYPDGACPDGAYPDGAYPGGAYPGGAGQLVLIVEDDPHLRRYLADQVKRLGYEPLVAAHGHAALDVLDRGERIELLFTDMIMPGGLTGLDLARRACRRHPALRVLLTSGHRAETEVQLASSDVQLLPKPYRQEDLARHLRAALSGPPGVV